MLSAPSMSFTCKPHHSTNIVDSSSLIVSGISPPLHCPDRSDRLPPTAFSSIELLRQRRQRRKYFFLLSGPNRWRWLCYVIGAIVFTLAVGGITLYFCWPRTPLIMMDDHAQSIYLPTDWGPDEHPWLRATWQLNVMLDNTQNWIPTRLQDLEWRMADDETNEVFAVSHASDSLTPVVLAPRSVESLRVVLHVSYESSDGMNDTTFQHLYNSCGPKKMGAPSELRVHLQVSISLWGIIWRRTAVVRPEAGTFLCPTT
ncbi:hypothetical protein BX666DRAFT_2109222 [Dichotomocladium elegans]|nr:hypothetical protein BX666DRAFT_2109222 [Dichotomocladium elegans]